MQTVALKPKRAEWKALLIGLLLLCVIMLFAPAVCVLPAMAAPLLACPLVGRKEEPVAWASAAVPCIASLIAGYDPLYAASLLLIGALPLLITRRIPIMQRPGLKGMLLYLSAMAVSMTAVLAAAAHMLGGPLQYSLPETFTAWVAESPDKQLLLQQFAMNGFVSIPEGYTVRSAAGTLMENVYSQQMLMSLKLTLEKLIAQELPVLFVQACILVGIFISLRLERMNGVLLIVEAHTAADKHTRVVAPPSFRMLAMPRSLRTAAFVLAVASLVLAGSGMDVAVLAGKLCYSAFYTMFCLQGAAVVVFLYTSTDPDRKTLAGVLAGAMFVIAPFVLFIIGLMDQRFHFRNPRTHKPDET